ncbi:MAG: hypothetical protein H7839_11665 [Magnetococcus sp. YQC-5]
MKQISCNARYLIVLMGWLMFYMPSEAVAFSMTGPLQVHSTLNEPFSADIPFTLEPGEDPPRVQVLVSLNSDYVGQSSANEASSRLTATLAFDDPSSVNGSKGKTGRILIAGTQPEGVPFMTLLLRIFHRDVSFVRNFSVVLDAFPTTGMEPVFPVPSKSPQVLPVTPGVGAKSVDKGLDWRSNGLLGVAVGLLMVAGSGWWAVARWRKRLKPMVGPLATQGQVSVDLASVAPSQIPVSETKSEPAIFEPLDLAPIQESHPAESPVSFIQEPQPAKRPVSPVPNPQPSERTVSPVSNPQPSERTVSPVSNPQPSERTVSPVHNPQPSERPVSPVHNPQPSERPVSPIQKPQPAESGVGATGGRIEPIMDSIFAVAGPLNASDLRALGQEVGMSVFHSLDKPVIGDTEYSGILAAASKSGLSLLKDEADPYDLDQELAAIGDYAQDPLSDGESVGSWAQESSTLASIGPFEVSTQAVKDFWSMSAGELDLDEAMDSISSFHNTSDEQEPAFMQTSHQTPPDPLDQEERNRRNRMSEEERVEALEFEPYDLDDNELVLRPPTPPRKSTFET